MSTPILYDPRIQTGYTVWHQDPYLTRLIIDLIEGMGVARFVETGTHMGWTCMWMATRFPKLPIFTVEIDEEYYNISVQNCKPFQNVSIFHNSSPDFLLALHAYFKAGLSLFWLDAHWWSPVPLKDECKVLSDLDRYIILIDDFASNNPRFKGDVFADGENNLAYVADSLKVRTCYKPNYQSFPPDHKGYGLFIKGVDFICPEWLKEDELNG